MQSLSQRTSLFQDDEAMSVFTHSEPKAVILDGLVSFFYRLLFEFPACQHQHHISCRINDILRGPINLARNDQPFAD